MVVISIFILLICSYLTGAIPTGYWFCKYFYGIDITKYGSGNIGASNVARVNGWIVFIPTFLIDAGKALGFLYIADFILKNYCCYQHTFSPIILLSLTLLCGNAYSIFIKFHGGKGVATSVGIILYLLPFEFIIIPAFFWVLILIIFKEAFMASLGAMLAILCTIFYFGHINSGQTFLLMWIFIWLIFRHKSNIKKWLSS